MVAEANNRWCLVASDMEHMYAILCVRIATTLSTETQIFNSPNLIKVDKIFSEPPVLEWSE